MTEMGERIWFHEANETRRIRPLNPTSPWVVFTLSMWVWSKIVLKFVRSKRTSARKLKANFFLLVMYPGREVAVADPGKGPGGPAPPYLWTKLRSKGPKNFRGVTPPPPPYRKVWIRHWVESGTVGESSFLSTWRPFETLGFCGESTYIMLFLFFSY